MKRIIIYAMGQVFQRYYEKLNWSEIIAIADKNKCNLNEFNGVPIINPDKIFKYSFDYIAIFSNMYFEEVKTQLIGNYFISEEKIISWRALLSDQTLKEQEIIDFYIKLINEFRFQKILDIGMLYFPKYFYVKDSLQFNLKAIMDGIGTIEYLMGQNLYEHVYDNINECNGIYEVALLWDIAVDIRDYIVKLQNHVRYVLFHSSYCLERIKKIDTDLNKFLIKKRISTSSGIFWLIDISPKLIPLEISIYVVMHKPYHVHNDDLYSPICVGEYTESRFVSEKTGDNISYLNEKINECTALYWIWKNTNTEYIGLNHYRRYFYNNKIDNYGNYLDKETAYNLLQEYDIILAPITFRYNETVLDVLFKSIDKDLCIEALDVLKRAMYKYQPDYVKLFNYVLNGYSFHPCNMFVTHRNILNLYCEWLFSFLIEAAENINITGYTNYDKRVMGFLAERLLTTWLLKQKLKIKELSCVII